MVLLSHLDLVGWEANEPLRGYLGWQKNQEGTLSADQHRWSYNNLLQPANHRCYPQKPDSLFHSLPCQDYNWLMWATQAVLPSPTSINDIHSFMVKKTKQKGLYKSESGGKKIMFTIETNHHLPFRPTAQMEWRIGGVAMGNSSFLYML